MNKFKFKTKISKKIFKFKKNKKIKINQMKKISKTITKKIKKHLNKANFPPLNAEATIFSLNQMKCRGEVSLVFCAIVINKPNFMEKFHKIRQIVGT